MKKYFVFAIAKEFYDVYKNNTNVLYETLKNLYGLSTEYVNYGLTVYNQLCVPINKDLLEAYYEDYRYVENHFRIGENIIEINKSCIVVLAKDNLKSAIKSLSYYNYPLFACNFKEREYCFLN